MKRWLDATSGYGTNTLRCWLNIRDSILAEYGVEDQSVYANVPEAAETAAAEPASEPVKVAAKTDTTETAAAPVTVAALGDILGGVMDDQPTAFMNVTEETASAQPATQPAPAAQPAVAETVPAPAPAPTEAPAPAPVPAPEPAPAPTEAPAHVHDWYAVGETVYGEPWEEVVGEQEEWQDVEVWGVQCIACGLKAEYQQSMMNHVANCTTKTWVDTIYREDGSVLVNGHYEDVGGSRPYTETVKKLVTVQDIVYHGGDREFHQTGWACSCGATKGMDE